jgi:hypothetical protein
MSFCQYLLEMCDCLWALGATLYGGTGASGCSEGTGTTEGVDVEGVGIC